MVPKSKDAFGLMMYDYYRHRPGTEVAERDDGFVDTSLGPKLYFSTYRAWPQYERNAIKYVRGRVLDIGCGAGRHAIHLQKQGHKVTGIDTSPLALKVARARGLKDARLLPLSKAGTMPDTFDTIIMMGNNFALLGTIAKGRKILQKMGRITSPSARIIAQNRDPYKTKLKEHLEYHAWNRQRGRLPGEARIRVRYKRAATPWFDFLMLAPREMKEMLAGTGWKVTRFIHGSNGLYIAIVEKMRQAATGRY